MFGASVGEHPAEACHRFNAQENLVFNFYRDEQFAASGANALA